VNFLHIFSYSSLPTGYCAITYFTYRQCDWECIAFQCRL